MKLNGKSQNTPNYSIILSLKLDQFSGSRPIRGRTILVCPCFVSLGDDYDQENGPINQY